MAKARITSNNGEGLYGIELEFDSTDLDSRIAALAQQLIDIEQQVLDAQVAVIDAEDVRDSLANDLDDAIDAYAAGGESAPVIAATTALAESVAQLNAARFRLQRISGQKLSLAARKTQLENTIIGSQASASDLVWCADYSTELATGAVVPVATPPGEITGAPWVILPQQHPDGYGGSYSRAAHGQLVPRLSMTPAATFVNWALLPGWQRWMPTHRIGTLTSVDQDNDTCNVTLDTARSSADPWPYTQGLNVNLAESTATVLTGVPIRYMTCNAAVFEAGDRVLVRFAQPSKANAGRGAWDEAEVIGFVSNPRECDIFFAPFSFAVSGEYVDDFNPSQTCFFCEPVGLDSCTTVSTHNQSMTLNESFVYCHDGDTITNGTLTVDYSWLRTQDAERDMATAPNFCDWVRTRSWTVAASCTIAVGGQTITLLTMTGSQGTTDRSATVGLEAKSVSHSLISRRITKSTHDAKIWFGLAQKSDVTYSNGSGTHIWTRWAVISIDGVEYITNESGDEVPLDLSLRDSTNATYCLFESGLLKIKSPDNADLVVENKNELNSLLTAPILVSFFDEVSIGDHEKDLLRQARNGELPVLSI